jgi:hypothetical protein
MPEKESTTAGIILPRSRKFYVWISIFYGFCAGDSIWFLFAKPRFHISNPQWMSWVDIAISGYCFWVLSKIFTALTNRIEKLICLLTMILFVLEIPNQLNELGYRWAHIWGNGRVSTALLVVAAILMFVRAFQVFRSAPAD